MCAVGRTCDAYSQNRRNSSGLYFAYDVFSVTMVEMARAPDIIACRSSASSFASGLVEIMKETVTKSFWRLEAR